jgi:hypothetical protein
MASKEIRQTEEGMVLWYSFNNAAKVASNLRMAGYALSQPDFFPSSTVDLYSREVNLNSRIRACFVPGKFGQALRLSGDDNPLIAQIPAGQFRPETGCIEFWAKINHLQNIEDELPAQRWLCQIGNRGAGGNCFFFLLRHQQNGLCNFNLSYDNPDVSKRPLIGGCVSGVYGDVLKNSAYMAIPFSKSSGWTDTDWHHYALVWDWSERIEDFTIEVYVDGRFLFSKRGMRSREQPGNGGDFPTWVDPAGTWQLFLTPYNGTHMSSSYDIDELKIWAYPKRNFVIQ